MAGGSKSQACNSCGCKVPAFFKLLDESSASKQDGSWLQIPPRFIQQYAARLARNAKITGPDGVVWNVVVKGDSITTIGLRKGWKTFVTAYGLKAGDLVVIRLVADSIFRAEIFGAKTAVGKCPEDEPEQSLVAPPPLTRAQERLGKNAAAAEKIARAIVNVRETAPAEGNVVKRSRGRPRKYSAPAGKVKSTPKNPAPTANNAVVVRQPVRDTGNATGQKRKTTVLEKSTASGEKTYQSVVFVSQRRGVTEAERARALELAQRFTSKNPFSVVVMKESHVYRGFWMGMRSDFARECLPEATTEMILVDSSTGKEWPARWLGRRKNCGISGGWRKFALDHSLEEGDVCIFEVVDASVDRPVLRIHIHRVVELENEHVGDCRHVKVVPNKDEADEVPTQPKKKRKVDVDIGSQAHCEQNKQLVVHVEPVAEREPHLSVKCYTQQTQAEESGDTVTVPSMDNAAVSSYKVGRLISRRKNKGVQECLVELEGTEGLRELKCLEKCGNGCWWVPLQSLEVEGGFQVCKV